MAFLNVIKKIWFTLWFYLRILKVNLLVGSYFNAKPINTEIVMEGDKKEFIFKPFKVIKVGYRSRDRPRPRSGHRIVCDDENIYCFGGYNPAMRVRGDGSWSPQRPLFRELWSFSMANRTWTAHSIENMPDELASIAMCMYGKNLMIYGGTGHPFGETCNNDVKVWNVIKREEKLHVFDVEGEKPPGLYGQAILCYGDSLLTIGGTNGFDYNLDVHRLNLNTLTWEPLYIGTRQTDDPEGRYRHEVARVGKKLYVFGGGTTDTEFELMEILIFDLETNKWSSQMANADNSICPPIAPSRRKWHSAVQVNTPNGVQVFVAGGNSGNVGECVFDQLWRLDISTLQWTLMRRSYLVRPVYFHAATVTPAGCMYVFGGIEPKTDTTNRNSTIRNNHLFKIWLCIPKLSEMCWEAVLYYNPDLAQRGKTDLMNEGFPLRFLDRLVEE